MRPTVLAAVSMSLVLSACRSADRELPREYRTLAVPTAFLGSADAVGTGSELFHRYCVLCHGERGDGRGLQREGLKPPPRDFTDPTWRAGITPRKAYFSIREGVAGTAMPGWKSLSEQDDWALVAYVLSLAPSK